MARNLKGQFLKGNKPLKGFKKGQYQGFGFKKGIVPWNKGLKGKENPFYRIPRSNEIKEKIGIGNKGKIVSEESRIKMSKAKKGVKPTKEIIEKRRLAIIKTWDKKGRKKHKRYIHIRDRKYLQWRSDVFKRDNWTCQTCGIRGCYIEAHHIKSWSNYSELRYKLENGVTLCLNCHKLTNNYKHKKYAK